MCFSYQIMWNLQIAQNKATYPLDLCKKIKGRFNLSKVRVCGMKTKFAQ